MIQRFVAYDEESHLEQALDLMGSEDSAIAALAFACHLQPSEWPQMTTKLKLEFLHILFGRIAQMEEEEDDDY